MLLCCDVLKIGSAFGGLVAHNELNVLFRVVSITMVLNFCRLSEAGRRVFVCVTPDRNIKPLVNLRADLPFRAGSTK